MLKRKPKAPPKFIAMSTAICRRYRPERSFGCRNSLRAPVGAVDECRAVVVDHTRVEGDRPDSTALRRAALVHDVARRGESREGRHLPRVAHENLLLPPPDGDDSRGFVILVLDREERLSIGIAEKWV